MERALKEEIIANAKEKASSLLKEMDEEEAKALSEVDSEMTVVFDREINAFRDKMEEKLREETARARLENKRALSLAKEDVFKKALDKSVNYFLSSQMYESFLKQVIGAAKEEFPKADFILHVNKEDASLLKKIAKDMTIKTDLNDRGVIIDIAKHPVQLNYTLSTLLSERENELRKYFYSQVFEGA